MASKELSLIVVFDDRYDAERAISDLEEAGFEKDQIGFAMRGDDIGTGGVMTDEVGVKDARGAIAGASTGAVVGGLLGATAAIAIPGIGPVLAAGVLASALGGAAAGTAVGGILGAMVGAEVSQEEAEYYQTHFHSGKAIVAVKPGERFELAERILRKHGGYNMRFSSHEPVPTSGIFSKP